MDTRRGHRTAGVMLQPLRALAVSSALRLSGLAVPG